LSTFVIVREGKKNVNLATANPNPPEQCKEHISQAKINRFE
jgi:hypothetical protein